MIFKVCFDCFEVFLAHHAPSSVCPKISCGGTEVFQIDELILETIITLTKKGFRTQYCCSGHVVDLANYFEGPYIDFYFKSCSSNVGDFDLPKGFIKEIKKEVYANTKIKLDDSKLQGKKFLEKLDIISNANKILYQWALDLPAI